MARKFCNLRLIKDRCHERDQREWVFEVREVKSENKKLSLFFEKCKVKKKCFHSFSRSAKWNQNAFTLFREVKSEIKMLRDRDREVKFSRILNNSRETRFLNRLKPACEESWCRTMWRISQLSMKTRRRRPVSSRIPSTSTRMTSTTLEWGSTLLEIWESLETQLGTKIEVILYPGPNFTLFSREKRVKYR